MYAGPMVAPKAISAPMMLGVATDGTSRSLPATLSLRRITR